MNTEHLENEIRLVEEELHTTEQHLCQLQGALEALQKRPAPTPEVEEALQDEVVKQARLRSEIGGIGLSIGHEFVLELVLHTFNSNQLKTLLESLQVAAAEMADEDGTASQ